MRVASKILLLAVLTFSVMGTVWAARTPAHAWLAFAMLMLAVLASSGFKVALPKGEGTMSLNFPFVLMALVQLAPWQAVMVTAVSVLVQCRFRVLKLFTTVQIAFNVANSINATLCAYLAYSFASRHGLMVAPALACAALVYFLLSTGFVALMIAWSSGQGAWQVWRTQFPWYLPFYLVGGGLAATAHLIGHAYGWLSSMLMIPVIYILYRSYTAQMVRVKERQQHLEETEALHLRTIEGLAMAIEAKDRNTHDHLFRVRNYASGIGKIFALSALEMQALETAAFLHDIGKLAVPEHIINKPGKLTPEEFEKMKIHPVVGADILERVRFPYPVVPIVRSHHEWWDGSGYPDGLKAEQIPVGARILSAVDCFDALASDRPYRKGLPVEEALGVVKRMAGTQFDPRVVAVLEEYFLRTEQESKNESVFEPLETEIDVWRGDAPAAGFAQAAASATQEGTPAGRGSEQRSAPTGPDPASMALDSLNMIAAASQEAQMLFELSLSLGNSLSLNETVSVMVSRLRRVIPFRCGALYLKHGDILTPQLIEGEGSRCFSADSIAVGEGISGWVALSGKSMLNANAEVEPNYRSRPDNPARLRSALAIPLFDLQQCAFGVLTLYAAQEDAFSRDHLRLLHVMETKLSFSVQNALRFNRVSSDAETDYLTSLPNARRLFLQLETELARCRETGRELAVIVCDLKRFKKVKDRHGKLAGNRLLTAIAREFRASCAPGETVARMGGEEFVFLMPDVRPDDVARRAGRIAQDVQTAVQTATHTAGLGLEVSVCVGIALYPADAATAEELLALADRRMYLNRASEADGEEDWEDGERESGLPVSDLQAPGLQEAVA